MSCRSFRLTLAILGVSLAPRMALAQSIASMPMPVPALVVVPSFGSSVLVRNLVPQTEIDRVVAKSRASQVSRRAGRAGRSRKSRAGKRAAIEPARD